MGWGEVPDCLDPEGDDPSRHGLRCVLGDTDDRNTDIEAANDPLERLHGKDGERAEDAARLGGIIIEDRHQAQAVLGESGVLAERRPQVPVPIRMAVFS